MTDKDAVYKAVKAVFKNALIFWAATFAAGAGLALTWASLSALADGGTATFVFYLVAAMILLTVSRVYYRRVDSVNPLNGMPTRNSIERVAELTDLALFAGVKLSYEDATRFEKTGRVNTRLRTVRAVSIGFFISVAILAVSGAPVAAVWLVLSAGLLVAFTTWAILDYRRRHDGGYRSFMTEAGTRLGQTLTADD